MVVLRFLVVLFAPELRTQNSLHRVHKSQLQTMKCVFNIAVPLIVAVMIMDLTVSSPSNLKNHFLGSSLAVPSSKASRELEMANLVMQKLMDVAYETAREMGVQDHELKEVQRKRNIIQACYFQAITCY